MTPSDEPEHDKDELGNLTESGKFDDGESAEYIDEKVIPSKCTDNPIQEEIENLVQPADSQKADSEVPNVEGVDQRDSFSLNLVTQQIIVALESSTSEVLRAFEQKLAYDSTKQKQIDNLHEEVQKHRTDLIARTNRPLVNGLIKLQSDIGKLVEGLKKKPAEALEPEIIYRAFIDIQDDIEMLLDQNGIVSFIEPVQKFAPKRQMFVRSVKTLDEQLVGTIAERLRSGFEQGDDLIQKERVSVYVLDKEKFRQKGEIPKNEGNNKGNVSDIEITSDLEKDA